MTAKADHDKRDEAREAREKEKHEAAKAADAKQGGRERVVPDDPEAQRREQEQQQTQDPLSDTLPPGLPIEPIEGLPSYRHAPGDPGHGEDETTRRQMEPHPGASDEMRAAPFAQPLPQPDHGIGTEGRRLAEERMGRGHVPNDPPPPLPRIKVDESPKFPEDLSARDARETEKVSTGGATQQQNQVFAGQVRPEEGRANLDVNTPKGEHLLGKQDTKSRLPRPPLMAGGKIQERRDDTRPGRNAVPDDTGRDQRSRDHDPGRSARHRDEERPRNQP
jgi:hypothetical protein